MQCNIRMTSDWEAVLRRFPKMHRITEVHAIMQADDLAIYYLQYFESWLRGFR